MLSGCHHSDSSGSITTPSTIGNIVELAAYTFNDNTDSLVNESQLVRSGAMENTPAVVKSTADDNEITLTNLISDNALTLDNANYQMSYSPAILTYKSSYSFAIKPIQSFNGDSSSSDDIELAIISTPNSKLGVNADGILILSNANGNYSTGIALQQEQWTHIILTADDEKQYVYVDGELVAEEANEYSYNWNEEANQVIIGANSSVGLLALQMQLDNVRTFRGTLDHEEIKALVQYDQGGLAADAREVYPVHVSNPAPFNGMQNVAPSGLILKWLTHEAMHVENSDFRVEVATDESFSNIIKQEVTSANELTVEGLDNSQDYYWRVTADGITSKTFHFITEAASPNADELTVMAFNVWSTAKTKTGSSTAPVYGSHYVAELIKHYGADVVFLTESAPMAQNVADELGWNVEFYSDSDQYLPAILTRYEIIDNSIGGTGGARHNKRLGVRVHSDELNQDIDVLLAHPNTGNDFGECSEQNECPASDSILEYPEGGQEIIEDMIASEQSKIVDKNFSLLFNTFEENDVGNLVLLGGDFNSVSNEDLVAGVERYENYVGVEFPASKFLKNKGFVDSYRTVYPDVTANIGATYGAATNTQDLRIDYVMHRDGNLSLQPVESRVFSEHPGGWVSDHRGLVTKYKVK